MIEVTVTEARENLADLLGKVQHGGEDVTIKKHGKPVARLEPIELPPSLRGSVTYHVSDEELIAPLWENWDPEFP